MRIPYIFLSDMKSADGMSEGRGDGWSKASNDECAHYNPMVRLMVISVIMDVDGREEGEKDFLYTFLERMDTGCIASSCKSNGERIPMMEGKNDIGALSPC